MWSLNFSGSYHIKTYWWFCPSNGSFTQTWFYQHHTLAYWNAKILKLLTHLLYNMKEISHYVTTNLIKSLWQVVKLLVADKISQNSNICLKAQIFSLAINTVTCFLWSDRLILLNFPSYPCWSNPGFPDIGVWWYSMVFNSHSHTSALPWNSPGLSACNRHVFVCVCNFYHLKILFQVCRPKFVKEKGREVTSTRSFSSSNNKQYLIFLGFWASKGPSFTAAVGSGDFTAPYSST